MVTERRIPSFDGTSLYVHDEGWGTPIIFCDGLGCDGYIWKHLRRTLAPGRRLIFWHYRGHGRSRAPSDANALGVSALRGDLSAVMDALHLPDAVMVGHSMGVQLLLDMALYAPERVRALVLLCGGPGRPLDHLYGSPRVGRAFAWLRRVALRWPQTAQAMWTKLLLSDACYAYVRAFEVNGKLVPDEDLRPYFSHLSTLDVQLFVRMVTHLQAHTVLPRLTQVRAPTLIVAGEHDTLTPVTLSEHMQQSIPGAELLVIQGGSHVAPLERPALVNARVRSFVQTYEAPGPGLEGSDGGAEHPDREQA